jgi:chromosome segregation ATPase
MTRRYDSKRQTLQSAIEKAQERVVGETKSHAIARCKHGQLQSEVKSTTAWLSDLREKFHQHQHQFESTLQQLESKNADRSSDKRSLAERQALLKSLQCEKAKFDIQLEEHQARCDEELATLKQQLKHERDQLGSSLVLAVSTEPSSNMQQLSPRFREKYERRFRQMQQAFRERLGILVSRYECMCFEMHLIQCQAAISVDANLAA